MSREAPINHQREREPADPLEQRQADQDPGVLKKLALGHRRIQAVHGPPHYPRAHHLKGVRENDGDEPDSKPPPVLAQVGVEAGQNTPFRRGR